MISVSTILYYVFSSIYFILFLSGVGILIYALTRKSQVDNKEGILLKKYKILILVFMCIIQCMASAMTILDQSLYLVWEYSWGYWVGHTMIVSSITYGLNLIGQILTFIMLITLIRFMAKMIHRAVTSEGRNTKINIITYDTSIVLCVLYGAISTGLFVLIPYSALPSMPFVLSKDTIYLMDLIGDILTAIGWGFLTLIVILTCILGIACSLKLYISIIQSKIFDVKEVVKRVTILLVLIQIVAIIQIGSTIVGVFASFESNLYLVSYILDKTNSLIFIILCTLVYNPMRILLQDLEKITT